MLITEKSIVDVFFNFVGFSKILRPISSPVTILKGMIIPSTKSFGNKIIPVNLVNVNAINSFINLNKKIAKFNFERNIVNLKEFTSLTIKDHEAFMLKGEKLLKNKHKNGNPNENRLKFTRLVKYLIENLKAFDPLIYSDNNILKRLERIIFRYDSYKGTRLL